MSFGDENKDIYIHRFTYDVYIVDNYTLKAYKLSELIIFILKVANIRCFILIAVEIFHNIIRSLCMCEIVC